MNKNRSISYLISVTGCTRMDKIRNPRVSKKKKLEIFNLNDRILKI
jgi:hypothetical protein